MTPPTWLARLPLSLVLAVGLGAGLLVGLGGPAQAGKDDARRHYENATAAFGLGRYADAATEYEAAFALRPDPALLYNCAQSHRLAGNKQRALELYRNYVRLYGGASNAEDARKHIGDLERDLAAEPAAASPGSPPAGVPVAAAPASALPSTSTPTPPRAALAPPARAQPAAPAPPAPPATVAMAPSTRPAGAAPAVLPGVDLKAAPAPGNASNPPAGGEGGLLRRPWFWAAVGVVVIGGVVGAVLLTGKDKDPKPSLGVIVGN